MQIKSHNLVCVQFDSTLGWVSLGFVLSRHLFPLIGCLFFSCEATLWTAHVCLSVFMSVWRSPFFEMIKISSSSAPRDMKFCTQLPYDHHGHIPSLGGSPTNPRMVTHQPKDGHPPNQRWSPTWRKCTTDMEFGTYTLLTKLTSVDNWSSTNPRMVTRQPKDGHPPDWSVRQT